MNTITKTIISLVICTIAFTNVSANISLFSDHRSFAVGDILTVHIQETSRATASSQSRQDRRQGNSINLQPGQGALGFIPMAGAGSNTEVNFRGDANTTRDASLSARMTVTIIEIDANGNLIIEGSRVVEINGEEETTILTGRVRSQDIGANNTIHSHNIADARISYSGSGPVSQATRVGLVSRFLNFIF
jgi:flagellar L-ring protein precursor FlgH